MIVFTPDGRNKIVKDKKCIEQMQQIMGTNPGFDITYDRGAYVRDVDVNGGVYVKDERQKIENDFGISFPVIRSGYWEQVLSQAQKDHERKQSIKQDVHAENPDTFEHVKVKMSPKPYEPTQEEHQSHESHNVRFVHGVRFASRPRVLTENTSNKWGIRSKCCVLESDYKFATDMPRGLIISMMVATDSIHGSIFAVVARRKGGQDDYVIQSFQNYIDWLGLVKADLKCDQESSTLDKVNAFVTRCQSTALIVTATSKGSKGSLERGK